MFLIDSTTVFVKYIDSSNNVSFDRSIQYACAQFKTNGDATQYLLCTNAIKLSIF